MSLATLVPHDWFWSFRKILLFSALPYRYRILTICKVQYLHLRTRGYSRANSLYSNWNRWVVKQMLWPCSNVWMMHGTYFKSSKMTQMWVRYTLYMDTLLLTHCDETRKKNHLSGLQFRDITLLSNVWSQDARGERMGKDVRSSSSSFFWARVVYCIDTEESKRPKWWNSTFIATSIDSQW